VSALYKLIANLREALERGGNGPAADSPAPHTNGAAMPVARAARRAELAASFARELEAVGGHFLGMLSPGEAAVRINELASSLQVRTAAIGEGIVLDTGLYADQFARRSNITVIRPGPVKDDEARAAMRDQLARCDLAIVEAPVAVASSGTVAIAATPSRPSSLTLLPPVNIILVDADRLVADLAEAIAMIGPTAIANHRVAFITGPSRTADIEKRIVLGVHGPRELYVALIWSGND